MLWNIWLIRRSFPKISPASGASRPEIQLIGNKWKLLILRNLLVRPWRFNELRKSLEGISQKVLTDSLRQMEADGIITRTVFPEVPPRVEYALSELGESMRSILQSMENWGTGYKASKANT